MKHAPNRLELILTGIVLFIAMILTGIIFPFIISTDSLPLFAIIGIAILIFVLMICGVEVIFNIFYIRWQRKKEKCSLQ